MSNTQEEHTQEDHTHDDSQNNETQSGSTQIESQNGSSQSSNQQSNTDTIVNFTLNETIVEPSIEIVNQQGTDTEGDTITKTIFTTTDPNSDVQINQLLVHEIQQYDNNETDSIVEEIRGYANQIKCSEFHGKGSIDDYKNLFEAAAKIANDTKHIDLNIEIDGFNEFADAADELSNLFKNFILRLQNINIINDRTFLTGILNALKKIVNLSNVFGEFKQTIALTSTIKIPKSAEHTKNIIENVMDEVNCAINYINHFVEPTENKPTGADLSETEKNIIDKATITINNWNDISQHGVTIALNNDPNIRFIKNSNDQLKIKTSILKNASSKLRIKLNNIMV